jgi:tRNA-dihydrouridine synthase
MAQAAEIAAGAGPDLIDLNMGCPVPKVFKTGAGAALLTEPERAVAVARAASEGSGLPVTVKLRSGVEPGDRSGLELAKRLAFDAGVAAIAFHPRPARQHHRGVPDYALVRELVDELSGSGVAVIVSGGLRTAGAARAAYEETGADAVMIARGSLGNPWIFAELVHGDGGEPTPQQIEAELLWLLDRAAEHWGAERAARNLRKFYPWYLERLGCGGSEADRFQRTEQLEQVRDLLSEAVRRPAGATL